MSVPHHAVSSSEVAYYPDRADDPKYRLMIADGRRNVAGALQQWDMDARENASRLIETGLLLTAF